MASPSSKSPDEDLTELFVGQPFAELFRRESADRWRVVGSGARRPWSPKARAVFRVVHSLDVDLAEYSTPSPANDGGCYVSAVFLDGGIEGKVGDYSFDEQGLWVHGPRAVLLLALQLGLRLPPGWRSEYGLEDETGASLRKRLRIDRVNGAPFPRAKKLWECPPRVPGGPVLNNWRVAGYRDPEFVKILRGMYEYRDALLEFYPHVPVTERRKHKPAPIAAILTLWERWEYTQGSCPSCAGKVCFASFAGMLSNGLVTGYCVGCGVCLSRKTGGAVTLVSSAQRCLEPTPYRLTYGWGFRFGEPWSPGLLPVLEEVGWTGRDE